MSRAVTLLGLAFRSHRTGLLANAAIGALGGFLSAAAFVQIAGTSPEERRVFAQQMEIVGKQLSYLLPPPEQLDTVEGFLTWRAFGALSIGFAIWGVLAATGAGRGDEERGLTEHWLSTGVSRLRWLATRAVGFVAAAAVAIIVTLAVTMLGALAVGEPLAVDAIALEGVLLVGLTLAAYGIGLFIAQLVVTRRAAGSLGAVVILALFFVNSASRSGVDVGPLRGLSPFYQFERSAPLLDPGRFDAGATLALFLGAATLVALSALAFARRDLGGPLVRLGTEPARGVRRPSADPLLRIPVLSVLDQGRGALLGWATGLAAFGYFMASLARTIIDNLMAIPAMRVYFERIGLAARSDFIGVMWFGTVLFILSGLVVAQTSSWASDDAEGRLEAALAAGASRGRIVIERIAALLVFVLVVAALSSAVVFLAARAFDIAVPGDRVALATVLIVPVVFALAGIGHALVGWRPRVAMVVVGALAVGSFFVQQFAPLFDVPEWVSNLSIYTLYGTPMTSDDRGGIAILSGIGIVGTAVALGAMRRRDVGR